jgi:hypothetical protein
MALSDRTNILDIGCGPGLLVHRTSSWLNGCKIFSIDRDTNFLNLIIRLLMMQSSWRIMSILASGMNRRTRFS